MIKTTHMLIDELSGYGNPNNKISRMVDSGDLVPIKRGLYETDAHAPGYALAGSIYGPSYLSFEYALFRHGLIPETVFTYTSATCRKRKAKSFDTSFGRFEYRDVPEKAFPFEVELATEGDYTYWVATAEKALCDQLYKMSPVASQKDLRALLFGDLRIDEEAFAGLCRHTVCSLAEWYRCNNVTLLAKLMQRRSR